MKKMLYGLLVLLSLLVVTACKEVTDDYNKSKKPAIVLKNQGQLAQIYDENSELEDVTFTVIFKNFEENEIDMDTVTIRWYIREILIESYNDLTEITQVVTSPGDISVRVVVTYLLDGEIKELEDNALISVMKVPTQILITNSFDVTKHQISVKLGPQSDLTFNGRITGNLNHPIIRWVILKQTTDEPEIYDDILAELTKNGGEAITSLNYHFVEPGSYIITLQTGEGQSQDANRYISNSIHVNVNYGDFELITDDSVVLSVNNQNDFKRVLRVLELDESVTGTGTYEWYLNGEKIEYDGLTYTHEETEVGSYLYQVKFRQLTTNQILEVTNPILIINGVEVESEEELLQGLSNHVDAIILTNDITYTGLNTLTLDYPVTIYGNGYELSSLEIQYFINITANNVRLSNLKISRANTYNLMITDAINVYLEDIEVEELGGGSNPTAFLSGEFGSGVYINRSEVVINNIKFNTGGLVGIRIEGNQGLDGRPARLELIGKFEYSNYDPLYLPIGSGKSAKDGIEVIANGFDYFALPAGNITIRRWDNQGEPITWEIYPQDKEEYIKGEFLDLFGIGINIDISFFNLEISGANGLDFVKMYIQIFQQYGKLDITPINGDEVLKTYYIIGHTDEVVYGLDQLVYSLTPELNIESMVEPKLDLEPGQYRVKVFIGEEFYLGHIIITVTEATE